MRVRSARLKSPSRQHVFDGAQPGFGLVTRTAMLPGRCLLSKPSCRGPAGIWSRDKNFRHAGVDTPVDRRAGSRRLPASGCGECYPWERVLGRIQRNGLHGEVKPVVPARDDPCRRGFTTKTNGGSVDSPGCSKTRCRHPACQYVPRCFAELAGFFHIVVNSGPLTVGSWPSN